MTAPAITDVRYVRYNGGRMGDIPQFGEGCEGVVGGAILTVTPANRAAVMRYLHGDESERAVFTVVKDEAYIASLQHCEAHGVAFESEAVQARHRHWIRQRREQSADLAALQDAAQRVAKKKQEIAALQAELTQLEVRHSEAAAKVADRFTECSLGADK